MALPKNDHSYGFVNIWDKEAAKEIAILLKGLPDGRILDQSRDMLFRFWRENGFDKLNVTLHDLRRASGYYLGRERGIEVMTLLQDHLRHSDINTTALYMRRPSTP